MTKMFRHYFLNGLKTILTGTDWFRSHGQKSVPRVKNFFSSILDTEDSLLK